MKPKINKVVYTIVGYQLCEETIKYLGETTFLINHFQHYVYGYEFCCNDYNVNWFTSFDKAKSALRKKIKMEYPKVKFKLKECIDVYRGRFWEVEFNE